MQHNKNKNAIVARDFARLVVLWVCEL